MQSLTCNAEYAWRGTLALDTGMDLSVWKVQKSIRQGRKHPMAEGMLPEILSGLADRQRLLLHEHVTLDGSVIEGAASLKGMQKKRSPRKKDLHDPGNLVSSFHGEKRSNKTHESLTDPEALLYRKGSNQAARHSYIAHVATENRHGLAVKADLTQATAPSEREAALRLLKAARGESRRRITVGAEKAYNTKDMISNLRAAQITQHIARYDTVRRSTIGKRTTRHSGYAISQRKRKRVEEVFGWLKNIDLMRKMRHRGETSSGGYSCCLWRPTISSVSGIRDMPELIPVEWIYPQLPETDTVIDDKRYRPFSPRKP